MGNAVRLAAEDARDKLAALARELGLPDGSNVPIAELFRKKYGMQAGNIIGIGSYIPNYAPPDAERADAGRDAVLDGRRRRRRGRGRHRDRPRARDAS